MTGTHLLCYSRRSPKVSWTLEVGGFCFPLDLSSLSMKGPEAHTPFSLYNCFSQFLKLSLSTLVLSISLNSVLQEDTWLMLSSKGMYTLKFLAKLFAQSIISWLQSPYSCVISPLRPSLSL